MGPWKGISCCISVFIAISASSEAGKWAFEALANELYFNIPSMGALKTSLEVWTCHRRCWSFSRVLFCRFRAVYCQSPRYADLFHYLISFMHWASDSILVFVLHLGPAQSCWQFGNVIVCAVVAHLLRSAAERVSRKHLIFGKYFSVINASYLNVTYIPIAKCWMKVHCIFFKPDW